MGSRWIGIYRGWVGGVGDRRGWVGLIAQTNHILDGWKLALLRYGSRHQTL